MASRVRVSDALAPWFTVLNVLALNQLNTGKTMKNEELPDVHKRYLFACVDTIYLQIYKFVSDKSPE